MVDALKRASAKRITVVAPFYPYARQDKKGRGREPISARLVADLFKAAGADRIMIVDLHAAQIQGFFDGPVDHLFAMPVLLEHFKNSLDPSTLTVVSPDMGRVRVADIWSDKLGAPLAIIHKRRDPLVPNQVSVHEIVGDGRGPRLPARRRPDRHRPHDRQGRRGAQGGRRHRRRRRGHARRLLATRPPRSCSATSSTGRRHRHAADPRREALGPPHRAADRAAARPRHPRGLRRRLRHEHVRRRGVGAPMTISTPRPWLSSYAEGVPTRPRPAETGSLYDLIAARSTTYPGNVALEFFGAHDDLRRARRADRPRGRGAAPARRAEGRPGRARAAELPAAHRRVLRGAAARRDRRRAQPALHAA